MKDSCFIAPIHDPKFKYGYEFIKSYNNYYDDENIFLVFSSRFESDNFRNLYPDLRYQSIIIDISIDDGIITKKKFLGLRHIFDNTHFEHVAVVDVDSIFIAKKDYSTLFRNYNERKKLFTNISSNIYVPRIIKSPIKFFSIEEQNKLNGIFKDNKYFWFNDIPIYNREYFNKFWTFIQSQLSNIVHLDFDFIIYAYYLLVHDIFSVQPFKLNNSDVISDLSVIEDQNRFDETTFKLLFEQSDSMWAKKYLPEMKNLFMLVHTDRK